MCKRFMMTAVISVVAIISTFSYAGEVRIYDANDQFIGISVDKTTANAYTIFIPTLKAYASLEVSPTNAYLSVNDDFYYDILGTPFALVPSRLYSACGMYFVSDSSVETVEVVSKDRDGSCSIEDYSATINLSPVTEVPIDAFPFNFPIVTPLRIEYADINNDVSFDGNMNKQLQREDFLILNDEFFDKKRSIK